MSRVVSQYVTELYVRLHVDVTDSSEAPCHARLTRECRKLAAVLVNYTYDVVQQDALIKVRQALNDAITVLGAACPTSGSLLVRDEANYRYCSIISSNRASNNQLFSASHYIDPAHVRSYHSRRSRPCDNVTTMKILGITVMRDALLKVWQALNDAIIVLGAACPTSGSLTVLTLKPV